MVLAVNHTSISSTCEPPQNAMRSGPGADPEQRGVGAAHRKRKMLPDRDHAAGHAAMSPSTKSRADNDLRTVCQPHDAAVCSPAPVVTRRLAPSIQHMWTGPLEAYLPLVYVNGGQVAIRNNTPQRTQP